MSTPEEMDALVARVWEDSRPRIMGRVAMLQAAAAAHADGGLPADQRREAEAEAHRLAGSLGMFGFPEASRVAHDLEVVLEGDDDMGTDLVVLVERLAAALPPA